jgi:uncharacterized protein YjbJ (UPF0337 family)
MRWLESGGQRHQENPLTSFLANSVYAARGNVTCCSNIRAKSADDRSPSEPRSKSMNSSNQDKAEGTGKKAMGSVKEKVGEAIGNPDLRDRGTAEKIEGKVQNKVGDVKKVFEK